MLIASSIAATGAQAMQKSLRLSAYSIANANTTAFKEKFIELANISSPVGDQTGTDASAMNLGLGVKIQGESTNLQQGAIRVTDNPLDLAIEGMGYFAVSDGTNTYYTRAGNFKKDATGYVVTPKGMTLTGVTGAIPVTALSITIDSKGNISYTEQTSITPKSAGTIQLFNFNNPASLQDIGNNLFAITTESGQAIPTIDEEWSIVQGALEDSNVEVVKQLVSVMETNNTYAMLMKIIEADKKNGDQTVATIS